MHQNSQNRQNLQQLGQGPVVGHTQEGVLSSVPPWARLVVPTPVAVDEQAALPRTWRRFGRQVNGLPHTPVLVTLVVVMPAVVMSAVVVAVTPAYLAWGGGVLVVLRGLAHDNSRRMVRAASSEAQWQTAYAH